MINLTRPEMDRTEVSGIQIGQYLGDEASANDVWAETKSDFPPTRTPTIYIAPH